mgnify:CR=1 FL=1
MEYKHITVLLNETVESVLTDPNGTYIDCTLGGGGHTSLLLSRLSEKGRVIAIDRDDVALENARKKLNDPRLTLVKSNFSEIGQIAEEYAPRAWTASWRIWASPVPRWTTLPEAFPIPRTLISICGGLRPRPSPPTIW